MFSVSVAVGINMTGREMRAWLRKEAKPEYRRHIPREPLDQWPSKGALIERGRMVEFCGGYVVLIRAKRDAFREFVGVLVHEMTHVTQMLLRARRVPLSEDTEEVHAYLVEHLTVAALNECYEK